MADSVSQLPLKLQTTWGCIRFIAFVVSWSVMIGLLNNLLDKDRLTFTCDPKPSDIVKGLCYDNYTSTVSRWVIPLNFVYITSAVVFGLWLAFLIYSAKVVPKIKEEQNEERKKSQSTQFWWMFLLHICTELIVLIAMLVLFCYFQTLSLPQIYKCHQQNNTSLISMRCNDFNNRQKSRLNTGIIALMSFTMFLCILDIIFLLIKSKKNFIQELINWESTSGPGNKPLELTRVCTDDGVPQEEEEQTNKEKRILNSQDGNNLFDLQNMQRDTDQVDNKTDLLVKLRSIASEKGFTISDNKASGNCMFYALSEQLQSVKEIPISHRELRKTVVHFLTNHPCTCDGTPLFDFVSDKYSSWTEYLGSMAKDGTWGDNLVLYAAAEHYKTVIRIIRSLGPETFIRPETPGTDTTNPLVLGFVDQLHYVSLQPKQDGFPLKKCQERLKSKYKNISEVPDIPWVETVVDMNTIYTQLSWFKKDAKPGRVVKTKLEDYPEIFTSEEQRNPKRILVRGRPGIGKSTFCKKAAYDWSQNSKQILRKFDLVLLIKLRDVCNLPDVSDILRVSELLASDSNISVDSLCKYITDHQDNVLLILDGFDEYSCDMKESPVRRIWDSNILSECTVVLTMRPTAKLKIGLWFEINGFDSKDQVKMFSQKILEDESVVNEFYEYLKEHDLTEIAEIPLLLILLCELWRTKHLRSDSTSRANIYTQFIEIMSAHLSAKEDAGSFEITEKELSKLGKLAYNALFKGHHNLLKSELTGDLQRIINKLMKVGLCHAFKRSRESPKESTSFIHKSFQEYIAGVYLKELAFSGNDEKGTFPSELDSRENIWEMREVIKFASELSEGSACAILNHLVRVLEDEGWPASLETIAAMETPSLYDLEDKIEPGFLMFMVDILLCCSAETKQNQFPTFLSCIGSVILINSDQLHNIANQHLLKSTELPNLIFFPEEVRKHPERDYCDLVSVLEDLNAVVVSSSGVKNASEFLKKYPARPIEQFFLKKEEKMHLYFAMINDEDVHGLSDCPFPTEMVKELIASPESTAQQSEQNTRTAVCSTQDADSTFLSTRHCLSLAWLINSGNFSFEKELLIEALPLVIAPREVACRNVTYSEIERSINFTDKLVRFEAGFFSITDLPATFATILTQSPNLRYLDFTCNFLGKRLSDLISCLSCVPHLQELYLNDVFMTKQQVHELTTAVRESEISKLESLYHDSKGKPLPEDEWPSDDYWKERPWCMPSSPSESEDESGSSAESEDEPGSSAESEDDSGSSAESGRAWVIS